MRQAPGPAADRAPPPLLEREHETAELDDAIAEVIAGRGNVTLITGPAGMGKTRLARYVESVAASSGLHVLRATGALIERELPFGLVRQLFTRSVADGSAQVSGAAALAQPALSADPAAAGNLGPVLHGLLWLLIDLTERSPVLLVVDDAQWSDEPSLAWLAHLALRCDGVAAGLVYVTRSGEPAVSEEHLAALAGMARRKIVPAPLSDAGVQALIAEQHGGDPDPAFVTASRAATGGVPFYVQELLRAVLADGIEPTRHAADHLASVTPASVRTGLLARLARLPSACSTFAQAAAVLGSGAELAVVAELAGVTAEEAAAAADVLIEAGILAPGLPIAFEHPLVGASVLEQLSAPRREVLHRRAAAVLRSRGAGVDRIAAQLLACEPGVDPQDGRDLAAAGQGALARGAAAVAAALLDRALREPLPEEARLSLLGMRAEALLNLGDTRACEAAEEAFASSGDVASRLRLCRAMLNAARFTDAARLAEQGLDDPSLEPDDVMRLRAQVLMAAETEHDWDRARPLLQDAQLPAGRSAAERGLLAQAAYASLSMGVPRERVLALARAAAQGEHDTYSAGVVAYALYMSEEFEEADAVHLACIERARIQGSETDWILMTGLRSIAKWWNGDLLLAEELGRAAYDAAQSTTPGSFAWGMAYTGLVQALLWRGDVDGAAAVVAAHEPYPEPRPGVHDRNIHLMRAWLATSRGQVAEAVEILRPYEEEGSGDLGPLPLNTHLVWPLTMRGEHEHARRLAEWDVDRCRGYGSRGFLAHALRHLAMTMPDADAVDVLDAALAAATASPMVMEQAECLLAAGAVRRRLNQRAAARSLLAQALDIADRIGAGRVAAAAREELVAAGARPRRAALSGVESLTASERRVCRLVATGATNREVAQALFVTPKTVEKHLYSAFGKLGVRSRRELARAFELPND